MFVKPYTTGGLRTVQHDMQDRISFILAFRRVANVFSTGRISLRGVRRSPTNIDSTSASKEGFTITKNITRTIIGIVGHSRPSRRVGMTGTRNLGRYHRLLGLTALNGCPKCLLRNVTYPKNYITNTKAVRTVGGSRASIKLCTGRSARGASDRARCVGRLSGLMSWCRWGEKCVSVCGSVYPLFCCELSCGVGLMVIVVFGSCSLSGLGWLYCFTFGGVFAV